MGRPLELAKLVRDEVAELVDAGVRFTAYNVTRRVRSHNVGMDVPHNEVRSAVHTIMAGYIEDGEYDFSLETFPTGIAAVYAPLGAPLGVLPVHAIPIGQNEDEEGEQAKPKKRGSKKVDRSPVKMLPVSSSAISHVGYDVEEQTLYLGFHGGRTYAYFDIPADLFARFMMADSIGKFYNAFIKLVEEE